MPEAHKRTTSGTRTTTVRRALQELRLRADQAAASFARDAVWRWLAALGWPAEAGMDVVVATNEAVTNTVEHAYRDGGPPGPVYVSGELQIDPDSGVRRVQLVVSDVGRWRHDTDLRGTHGLSLMHASMEMVRVRQQPIGTHVTLLSRPVPLA